MGRGVKTEMLRAHRWAIEQQHAPTLEHAVDDGSRKVVVVEDFAPSVGVFVRREDHRATCLMALRDDVVEDVRSVVAVREIADLVDDEHVR